MAQRTRAQRLNGIFPLSYMGVVPVSPVNFVIDNRAPTPNDSKNFYIGDLWLDDSNLSLNPPIAPTASDLWMLVSLSGNIATWVNFGAGNLETLTGNSGGPVAPDGADNINVVGDGTTINVVGNPATHTLTISAIGSGLLETLTGNTGVAHPVAGNINIVTANSTPIFVGSGSTLTIDFARTTNLLLGSDGSIAAGTENVGYGQGAGAAITNGASNTFIGFEAGLLYTNGNESVGIGIGALESAVAGASLNTAVGGLSLSNVAGAAVENVAIGYNAGGNYTTTESNNIIIGANNVGVTGESDVIRIGIEGTQTEAFMAGIAGVTVSNQLPVVINSVTGQLGTVPAPTATPAFSAYLSTDPTNVTGDTTVYPVVCDTVFFNVGGSYNNGTGVFTVPTTGIYQFIFTCTLANLSLLTTSTTPNSVDLLISIFNGASLVFNGLQCNQAVWGDNTNTWQGTMTYIFECTAGWTVYPSAVCVSYNGAKSTGLIGNIVLMTGNDARTIFQGFLIS